MKLKAFLAGKRGVCPECGIKFQIPNVPDGTDATAQGSLPLPDAAAAPEANAREMQRGERAATFEFDWKSLDPPAMRPAETPPARPANAPTAEPNWFLKIADGRQFGPAAPAVMERWIAEGRVAADCWVWREDWAQWRAASEAFSALRGPSRAAETQSAAPAVAIHTEAAGRHNSPSRRRHLLVAGTLAAVVLVLGGVFVFVIAN